MRGIPPLQPHATFRLYRRMGLRQYILCGGADGLVIWSYQGLDTLRYALHFLIGAPDPAERTLRLHDMASAAAIPNAEWYPTAVISTIRIHSYGQHLLALQTTDRRATWWIHERDRRSLRTFLERTFPTRFVDTNITFRGTLGS